MTSTTGVPTMEQIYAIRSEIATRWDGISKEERARILGRERQRRKRERDRARGEDGRKKQKIYEARYREDHREEIAVRNHRRRVGVFVSKYGPDSADHYHHRLGTLFRKISPPP